MTTHHYRRDIDGLRGIAVLAVVLFHAFATLVPGGFVGVDIFFVISGYLITGILLRDLQAGQFSYRQFYARRVRRIFPALAVVLAACLLVGYMILFPKELAALGKHTAAGSIFISNIALWNEGGYFDGMATLKPLLHLWSLGVEEQFYIVWPLMLWGIWRLKRKGLWLLGGCILLSFGLNIFTVEANPTAAFYLPHARLWELMLGAALVVWNDRILRFGRHEILAWVGLVLIVAACFLFQESQAFPGWRAALPVVGACLLIGAGAQAWVNRQLLGAAPLVWFGRISYPLYLWHWPLLVFLRIIEGDALDWTLRAGAVLLAVLLAWITTTWIEKPIRFGRYRNASGAIGIALAMMAILGVLGWATWQAKGLPNRYPEQREILADMEIPDALYDLYQGCPVPMPNGKKSDWCFTSGTGTPTLALFGDSHADHVFSGRADAPFHYNMLLLVQSSCAPLLDIEAHFVGRKDKCSDFVKRSVEMLRNTPSVDTVLLAARSYFYVNDAVESPENTGKRSAQNWRMKSLHPEEAGMSKPELYYRGLDRTIRALEEAGKKVILIADTPEYDFMPARCVARRFYVTSDGAPLCDMPRAEHVARHEKSRALVTQLAQAHPKLRVFDPFDALCDATRCFMGTPEMLYYRDTHHLSVRGSEYIAPYLAKAIQHSHTETGR